jgi:hypothetical protein
MRPRFGRTAAALLALVLVFAAPAARADALSAVVDKYIAWRGGPAFEHLRSIHETLAVEIGGIKGTGEDWEARGTAARSNLDLGVAKTITVWAPTGAWGQTASGQIDSMPATDAEETRRNIALDFADVFHGRDGAHLALLAPETRDGRTWAVVRFTFGDEDVYDAFIDPLTGELDGWRVTEDRLTRFERVSDWRVVDGVRMPFRQTATSDLPGGNSAATTLTLEINRPVPASLLTRPAPLKRAHFAKGATSTGWIDFVLDGDHIYFNAKINGRPAVVMLDSGASASVLDTRFVSEIGLTPQGAFTTLGTGGAATEAVVPGVEFELGDNLTLGKLTVGAMDMRSIGAIMGHPLPAVLGGEAFNELAVDIDFAHHRLAFRDPASVTKPENAVTIPLVRSSGGRSIPVSVEGGPEVPFDFDLGDGAAMLVFPAYYKPHRMLEGRRTSQALGGAVGGVHPETIATVQKAEIGGFVFTDIPAEFSADKESGANANSTLGNVGLPILSRFHLIVDYAHDRLIATPDPEAMARPFERDRLGMWLKDADAAFEVGFVAPGSPAEAADFKVGDRILSIDGRPPTAWTREQMMSLYVGDAGRAVTFTMSDGQVRRLKLTDYF